jgi:para-nitrobenzyl esterase
MLEGCDRASFDRIAQSFQGAWVEFARSGRPECPGVPSWQQYTGSDQFSMHFNTETRLVVNADGYIRELWNDGTG